MGFGSKSRVLHPGRYAEREAARILDNTTKQIDTFLDARGLNADAVNAVLDIVENYGNTIKPEDLQGVLVNFKHLVPKIEEAIPVFTQTAQTVQRAVKPIAVGAVMAGVGAMTTAAATITIAAAPARAPFMRFAAATRITIAPPSPIKPFTI